LRGDTCDVVDRLLELARPSEGADDAELVLCENLDASQRVVHLFLPARARTPEAFNRAIAGLSGLSVSAGAASDDDLITRGRGDGGGPVRVVYGEPFVADDIRVSGHVVSLRRHAIGFFQANRFLLTPFVQHVVDHVDRGGPLVDLYAGCGLFSVSASVSHDIRVIAVEGDAISARDLQENVGVSRAAVEPLHESVESFVARRHPSPGTVIVDPPRTGLSPAALGGVLHLAPRRVIYVSCDVATLARDARQLCEGGYRLGAIDAFDLFPNTPHIETVAVFDR
jgi:tRNA/tmRNA/rRNA uracil-C5-methylase (TrmA/RlmC/RlmD family)